MGWETYCCICGNSCVSLCTVIKNDDNFEELIKDKTIIIKDLVKKSKWVEKATMLLQNNKVVHGCEEVSYAGVFEDKNSKKYIEILSFLRTSNGGFDGLLDYIDSGIFIHTNCWKYIKIKYNKELKYSDIPVEFKNKTLIPQINYGSIIKYQHQDIDYLKIINDKNMYMLSDPLKTDKMNDIRLKKIINQFKLKTELRPSPSMSATFNKTGDIRIGNNGKFWIIKNNKWVEIKDKIIKKSIIVNDNNKNKSILSKINMIPQLGEKNTKLIFINNFVHKKDTIEIQFIGNEENINKICE